MQHAQVSAATAAATQRLHPWCNVSARARHPAADAASAPLISSAAARR